MARLVLAKNNPDEDSNEEQEIFIIIETKGLSDEQLEENFDITIKDSLPLEVDAGELDDWPADTVLGPYDVVEA